MTNVLDLMRPELKSLRSYQAGRKGIEKGLWLDANESPWGALNRYQFDVPTILKDQLALFYQTDPEQILLTRGSSEGIDLLVRLFCLPYQDTVLICSPTFTLYAQSAFLQGAKVCDVPLLKENNFSLDLMGIRESFKNNIKIVFLCTPNNPIGITISLSEMKEVLAIAQGKAIVVIDEAYIEFSRTESVIDLIDQYPHLVVLRTLSKAFGMAAIRCGAVIAQPQIVQALEVILSPSAFSTLALTAAIEGTKPEKIAALPHQIQTIIMQRDKLKAQLAQLSIVKYIWESDANFLLVEFQDAQFVYDYCCQLGIYVRNVSGMPDLNNCLRISIGDEAQNVRLMTVLKECAQLAIPSTIS